MGDTAFFDTEDFLNLLLGSAVIGTAFTAFRQTFSFKALSFYVVVGLVVLLLREAGQRAVAHWMDAYVDLKVSSEGVLVTLLAAGISVVGEMNLLLLFPVFNGFSVESHEHWGKSIDAMWMKRQYWIVSGGIVMLFLGWFAAFAADFNGVAEAISLFTFFQMLPFDYKDLPTGTLDGAFILRWSGVSWLLFTGFSIITIVLSS
ncbi:MAG: hypothetical protein ABEJ93_01245 [Candidatus Nanohalobium sp.]